MHKHKDPANHDFWNPSGQGPSKQNGKIFRFMFMWSSGPAVSVVTQKKGIFPAVTCTGQKPR